MGIGFCMTTAKHILIKKIRASDSRRKWGDVLDLTFANLMELHKKLGLHLTQEELEQILPYEVKVVSTEDPGGYQELKVGKPDPDSSEGKKGSVSSDQDPVPIDNV